MTALMRKKTSEAPGPAPFLGKLVLVECDGVRHLAKQGQDGQWRTVSRQKVMKGYIVVVKVMR